MGPLGCIASPPSGQPQGADLLLSGKSLAGLARRRIDCSIALGRRWLDQVLAGTSVDEVAALEGCTKQHVANAIPLAFLAPEVVRAIVGARLPRGISARRIAQPELEWARQWEMLGIRR